VLPAASAGPRDGDVIWDAARRSATGAVNRELYSPAMSAPAIRTPDQRLRVFVSSTLQELAAERKAAREGIERIHLSPVMPRLVYVKSAPEREPRLVRMLERIEGDDLSYRFFVDPTELTELVARDLALVLTERFDKAEAPDTTPPVEATPLYVAPVEHGELIGRAALVDEVQRRLTGGPLVTLTGPGGTGKTSLAIHLANTLADRFPDGVFYVQLAAVRDSKEVAQTLATTLELPLPQGGADPLRLVTGFLRAKRALLVLDNFEQVIEAAPDVASLPRSGDPRHEPQAAPRPRGAGGPGTAARGRGRRCGDAAVRDASSGRTTWH